MLFKEENKVPVRVFNALLGIPEDHGSKTCLQKGGHLIYVKVQRAWVGLGNAPTRCG